MIPYALRRTGGKLIEIAVLLGIALLAALALYLVGDTPCPPGAQRVTGWKGGERVDLCIQEAPR